LKITFKLKRLIREYEFLLEDVDDVLEIHKTANQELNRAIRLAKDENVAETEFEKEEDDEEIETFEDTPERKVLKRLFRKIVFKCHPDRLSNEISEGERVKMQDLYEKAVLAHDRDNWGLMVVVAIKLEIELPEEAENMIERISEEAEGLKNHISQLTNSFAWQWYHAQEELQKKMIDDYLNTLKLIKKRNSQKKTKRILVIGHPRTGTGYTAKLLQSWGLDVQHERMGKDGISHWGMAVGGDNPVIFSNFIDNITFNDIKWETIIYCVRDPKTSIPSIAYTENTNKESFEYRMKWGKFLNRDNEIINSINSITSWDRLIHNNVKPDFIFRIEDESRKLFDYLKNKNIEVKWNDSVIGKPQNTRQHKRWSTLVEENDYVAGRYKRKINEYCIKYGYKKLF